MLDTIKGLEGVLYIRDNFIVYSKDNKSHDEALKRLLQTFRECGLTFNPKKCKFCKRKIEYFGFLFTKDGIKPCPRKVHVLKEMKPPKDATRKSYPYSRWPSIHLVFSPISRN